ncbi:thiamine pyrophosphate-dependent enzyme [Alkalilacustris brevis]|uniref:thiamine pyrophosphate-dependent enzyme n=1 Tax=Alkalilacustris brevis TaxID=2026338 RepID=UPI000E0DD33D
MVEQRDRGRRTSAHRGVGRARFGPDFAAIARASRALGLKATSHEEFKAALAEALDHVQHRRGPALIDAAIRPE